MPNTIDPVLAQIRDMVKSIVGPRRFTEARGSVKGLETITFSLPTYPNWPGTIVLGKDEEKWVLLEVSEKFSSYEKTFERITRGKS
ncbi:MAG: hypothetical protein WC385_00545 [Candidatus Paceibacterota bacterium]|jgi:hypothetical protein